MAARKAPWPMWSVAILLHGMRTTTSTMVNTITSVESPESMLEVIVHAPGGGYVHTAATNGTRRQKGPGTYATSSLAGDAPCLTCGRLAYQYVQPGHSASFPPVSFPEPGGGAIVSHFSVRAQGDICAAGNLQLTLSGVTATSSTCAGPSPCQCNMNHCVSCTATSAQYPGGIPGWTWGTHALTPSFSGGGMAIESLIIDIFYITGTPSPTSHPTPSPTPDPTYPSAPEVPMGMHGAEDPMAGGAFGAQSGSGSFGAVAATGDPHLQNVFGERFDLMRPGNHVLIHIPRGARVADALLRVEAVARRLGSQCTDMYFQEINITGEWAEKKYHRGGVGLHFQAQHMRDETPSWVTFGKVQVKVTHGRTQQGTLYLNFHVKNLGRAGFVVGGLLGADDHTEAAMFPKDCVHHISLLQTAALNGQNAPASSIAEGSLA